MYTQRHENFLIECLKARDQPFFPEASFGASDWKEFIQLCRRQCMAPFLYGKIQTLRNHVPEHVLTEFQESYFKYAARTFILSREFAEVFKRLRKEGILFIVLKGTYLAEEVYGDPALRPVSDLDLLVREKDLARIAEVLGELNYSPDISELRDRARHHLRPFVKTGAVPIEIHRDIQNLRGPSPEDIEGLWTRAKWTRVGGVEVLALSTEDLLLHLSMHAVQHHYSIKLISICDISEILRCRSEQIKWEQLLLMANRWKARNALFLMFRLAQDFFRARVPEGILTGLKPRDFDDRYLKFAQEQVFAETRFISENLAQMYLSRKFTDRVRIAYRRLFPSREFIHSSYFHSKTSKWFYAYYLVRTIELITKYGRIVCQMFLKDKEGLRLPSEKRAKALYEWVSAD
jgi:hypothetical protein